MGNIHAVLYASSLTQRRQETRRPLRIAVEILIEGSRLINGRSLDVNSTMIGVLSDANIRRGTRCKLRAGIPIDDGYDSQCVSAVVRVLSCVFSSDAGGFRCEMQFDSMPADTRHVLTEFLNS